MALAKSIHHVSVQITDLERARDFYEGVLGLVPIERPDFGFPGVWYGIGALQVHLIGEVPGMGRATPPEGLSPVATHLAFEIEDYAATLMWRRSHSARRSDNSSSGIPTATSSN